MESWVALDIFYSTQKSRKNPSKLNSQKSFKIFGKNLMILILRFQFVDLVERFVGFGEECVDWQTAYLIERIGMLYRLEPFLTWVEIEYAFHLSPHPLTLSNLLLHGDFTCRFFGNVVRLNR